MYNIDNIRFLINVRKSTSCSDHDRMKWICKHTNSKAFLDSENMDEEPIGNSFATGSYKCLSISSDYYSYCSGFQIYSSVMHGNKWKIMLAVWKNIHSAINCFLNSWILYTGIFCTGLWLNRQKVCLNVIV